MQFTSPEPWRRNIVLIAAVLLALTASIWFRRRSASSDFKTPLP